ncbi:MAG: GNAT family N-acetyltransferase [Alphaproteobacteria bacterium]|nr:GNAT family N-acetyltransferase [Alphaproteobacteria bacterium]NNF23533.1 GNAT family N-acetyltransferase [Paracoccaceae bacterium]
MTNPSPDIRRASPADKAAVDHVLQASYGALLKPDYTPGTLAEVLPLITKAKPQLLTSGTYYIAELDGQAAAVGGWTATVPMRDEAVPGQAHIRHVACHPKHTGQGVSRALMETILNDIRAAGLTEIMCYSTLTAEGFYARLGFERQRAFDLMLTETVALPSIVMRRRAKTCRAGAVSRSDRTS